MAHIFMHVLEVRELISCGLMNKARGAHRIDMLKAFFQSGPCFLRDLSLNDQLVLISNESGYYPCRFAHSFVVLLFVVKYCGNEDA